MTDWHLSMQQTFEYYIVDPNTWKDKEKIENVISSSISWDLNTETLGSATINVNEPMGECYIRIYMITIQNKITNKYPLGVFLVQTPSYTFDGKTKNISLEAYTPLIELKENYPPLGYSIIKDENIMSMAYKIVREQVRAPVYETKDEQKLQYNFIANTDDTWVSFTTDLISNAKYKLGLDEMGRVLFNKVQDTKSLQPVWTYNDDNSSILYPDLNIDHDLYGIPNVIEVVYSNGSDYYYGIAVNDDPNSPISTVSRGRKISKRITDPQIIGNPTEEEIQQYAEAVLKEMSTLEYTITYTHAYCPTRLGDCVRLNYRRIGLNGIKAKVISQTIDCIPGCPVTEKAVFTAELWGGDK